MIISPMAYLNLEDYNYELPSERIAQHLANPRDSCRLLVIGKDKLEHKRFTDIVSYLNKDDVLVLNSTKVSNAKIIGKKATGGPAEIVLVKKLDNLTWECRIKSRNPHVGVKYIFKNGSGVIESLKGELYILKFSSSKIIDEAILPTPPYISSKIKDDEYQTVYAKKQGSLAAPTAGLHFTKKILSQLQKKGVKIVYITLHVSYGTFKSIDYGIENYVMDPEWFEIPVGTAHAINNRKGRLVVCGTTTLKALETSSKNGKVIAGKGESTLFIYPPYSFKSGADLLITNFHLPKSTLILLTCAFGGRERILKAYQEAINEKYRFYSLGDATLVFK